MLDDSTKRSFCFRNFQVGNMAISVERVGKNRTGYDFYLARCILCMIRKIK